MKHPVIVFMKALPIPVRPLAMWLILAALPCSLTAASAAPVPCDDFPTDLMPAPSGACEVAAPVRFGTSAVVLEQFSLRLPTHPITPPPEGSSQEQACDFTLQCMLSPDNGATFQQVRVPASASIKYTCASGQCAVEMLSLSASLPDGVMLRESPTKASLGQTKRSAAPLGGYRISSFFDIFIELSMDSGKTWTPASGPARAVQCALAHEVRSHTYNPTWTRLACVAPVRFTPSVWVRNTDFAEATDSIEPPAPGTSADSILHTTCTGEVSVDGGTTFSAFSSQANLTLRITADSSPISSITRHFATEILDLTVDTGGGAAGGPSFKLRESPTKQTLGQTSVRRCPDGSCRISSFFDVFLELSMTGGQTWAPAPDGCATFASYFNPREYRLASDFLPLPASLVSDDDSPVGFGETGVALWRIRKRPEMLRQAPPSAGQEVRQMDGSADLLLSRDGGASFTRFHVPVLSDGVVSPYQIGGGHDSPVECVSFSCTVPGPTPVMIRESPTKQSLGTTRKRVANGEYMIGQSTQVCLEVSLDGGTTWTPADAPLRLSLLPYVEQTCVCKTDFMPPRTGSFEADPPDAGVSYTLSRDYMMKGPKKMLSLNSSAPQPPPVRAGDTAVIDFACTVSYDFSDDGGLTWLPVEGQGSCTMAVTNPLHKEDSSVANNPLYDTEMLALSVTLPNGAMIRESPTKASTGKTSARFTLKDDRGYPLDCFFDVFTELSVDGGQTWAAGDDSVHLTLHNAPDAAFVCSDWMPYATRLRACDGGFSARVSSTQSLRDLDLDCDSPDLQVFSARAPMPAPGSPPVTQEMSVPASFEYSTDGGTTHTAVHATASLTLRCDEFSAASTTSPGSSCRIEVLQCNISGPPGAPMLRESPTKQSLGKTTCRPAPSGSRVESFFDIFLELSFDNGNTWLPACDSLHMGSVETSTPVVFADNLIPPPGVLATRGGALHPRTSDGKAQGGLSVPAPNVWRVPAPAAGQSATVSGSCTAELSISNDAGATFNTVRAPLFMRYEMTNVMTDSVQTRFDTEMLQLECAGGSLPANWKLRESPTLPSKGKTSMRPRPDGGCATSSFFDVFLELSTDGGRSWSPFDLPLHLELGDAPVSGVAFEDMWPTGGDYDFNDLAVGDPHFDSKFLDGSSLDAFGMTFDPANAVTLPPPGTSIINNRTCTCPCGLSVSGTVPRKLVVLVGGPATVKITAGPASPDGIRSFDTEMLSLDLTLPDGTMLRESPTKQSLGRLHQTPAASGTGFTISSFFDVFLELSTDGGNTWSPADRAVHLDFATPDLAVAGPNGVDLTNGSSLDFGACLVGSPRQLACVLSNHGQAALSIPSLSITGSSAADFSVSPAPPFTLPPNGGTLAVQVTFASSSAGEKSAVLHLASNGPGASSFNLTLTAHALVPDGDDDNDGVTNAQELALVACGFNPLIDSRAQIQELRARGFFRSSDMHALALGRPVLARSLDNHFHLQVGIRESPTLQTWAPLTGFSATCDKTTGLLDLDVTPGTSSTMFYQVFGGVP
ncbi:MAG: choice-of-anchor D domain-containing protein [Verrucomicrobiota bacterium]